MDTEFITGAGPIDSPEVWDLIERLEADLERALGIRPEFCLVLLSTYNDDGAARLQGCTNSPRATSILKAAITAGFDEPDEPVTLSS